LLQLLTAQLTSLTSNIYSQYIHTNVITVILQGINIACNMQRQSK